MAFKLLAGVDIATHRQIRHVVAVLEVDSRAAFAVHGRLIRLRCSGDSGSVSIWNRLLIAYHRCGILFQARKLFDTMLIRDTASYNTMMSLQAGNSGLHLHLYWQMLRHGLAPDRITLSTLLAGSAGEGTPPPCFSEHVHAHAVKFGLTTDKFIGSALISAYGRCRGIVEATKAFEDVSAPDTVCWNMMMDVCSRRGSRDLAVDVFSRMRMQGQGSLDSFALASVLKTCLRYADLPLGMQLHGCALKAGLETETSAAGNALVWAYLRSGGEVDSALRVFSTLLAPDVISWTAVVVGLVHRGLAVEATRFYFDMLRHGERENEFFFAGLLPAFGALASIRHGRMVHCRICKSMFNSDLVVANALIDMYFKCGSPEDANCAFEAMGKHDATSWTVMICGVGQHGGGRTALDTFEMMKREGFEPDDVTFLAILSACRHGGLVKEGLEVFLSMVADYDIMPRREHCACAVDLLARTGQLEEAESFIRKIGTGLDSMAWESLLGACRMHGKIELGQSSAGKAAEFCENSVLVMLSNMYAEQCRWREKEKLRGLFDSGRLRKEAACSILS